MKDENRRGGTGAHLRTCAAKPARTTESRSASRCGPRGLRLTSGSGRRGAAGRLGFSRPGMSVTRYAANGARTPTVVGWARRRCQSVRRVRVFLLWRRIARCRVGRATLSSRTASQNQRRSPTARRASGPERAVRRASGAYGAILRPAACLMPIRFMSASCCLGLRSGAFLWNSSCSPLPMTMPMWWLRLAIGNSLFSLRPVRRLRRPATEPAQYIRRVHYPEEEVHPVPLGVLLFGDAQLPHER